jgi:hypothetical protein
MEGVSVFIQPGILAVDHFSDACPPIAIIDRLALPAARGHCDSPNK